MTTETLLKHAFEANDEASFAQIHARTYPYVVRVAMSVTRNESLAEDAAQATFLILFKRGRKIRDEAALMSWLWKTARHTAFRAVRDEKRMKKREAEAHSRTVEPKEIDSNIFNALGVLNEKDRNLLLLRYYSQHSVEEVATASGISVSAAQMRISRALEKVRKRAGILSIPALIALLAPPDATAAIPPLATASSKAVSLASVPAWQLSLAPISLVLGSAPLRYGAFFVFALLGTGTTVWYLSHPRYEIDTVKLNQIDQLLSGRYNGTVISKYSSGAVSWPDENGKDNNRNGVTFVIRKFDEPLRIVNRVQAGDRQVETFSFYPAKGTNKLVTDEGNFTYELNGNQFIVRGEVVNTHILQTKDKSGKWTKQTFVDMAKVMFNFKVKDDGTVRVEVSIDSRFSAAEIYNLRRIK